MPQVNERIHHADFATGTVVIIRTTEGSNVVDVDNGGNVDG